MKTKLLFLLTLCFIQASAQEINHRQDYSGGASMTSYGRAALNGKWQFDITPVAFSPSLVEYPFTLATKTQYWSRNGWSTTLQADGYLTPGHFYWDAFGYSRIPHIRPAGQLFWTVNLPIRNREIIKTKLEEVSIDLVETSVPNLFGFGFHDEIVPATSYHPFETMVNRDIHVTSGLLFNRIRVPGVYTLSSSSFSPNVVEAWPFGQSLSGFLGITKQNYSIRSIKTSQERNVIKLRESSFKIGLLLPLNYTILGQDGYIEPSSVKSRFYRFPRPYYRKFNGPTLGFHLGSTHYINRQELSKGGKNPSKITELELGVTWLPWDFYSGEIPPLQFRVVARPGLWKDRVSKKPLTSKHWEHLP
jgi:hypothetical protein